MAPLIAITGGIGSGKSAVSKCLEAWGLPVYDSDSRARGIMDRDQKIISAIAESISPEAVAGGVINRKLLAKIVFADHAKLETLNSIVHSRVIADLRRWHAEGSRHPILFVETAILIESNLHHEVNEVWLVEASEETRISRACRRDNAPRDAIKARIDSQRPGVTAEDLDIPLHIIDNDGRLPLLPRLSELLALHGLTSLRGQWRN